MFARDVVVPDGRGRDRRWRWSQRIGGRQILHIGFLTERDAMDDRQRALDQIYGIAPAEAPLTLGGALERLLATKTEIQEPVSFRGNRVNSVRRSAPCGAGN